MLLKTTNTGTWFKIKQYEGGNISSEQADVISEPDV
jgi:hypothetical protein